MHPKMPTLGPPPKASPMPKVIVIALLVGGAAGGAFWWKRHRAPQSEATSAAATPAPAPAQPTQAVEAAGGIDAGVAEAPHAPTTRDLLRQAGLKAITTTINGPLESAIVDAAGPEVGPALTQVVTRTLVWWVEVPNEVLRGDRLSILYEERPNDEPVVHGVIFESGKDGQTHEAWLYKASTDHWPRFYEPDGKELELRLASAPLDDYEQVTSRLRDGRHHKGVDFKTPEGTPVKATFDGTVARRNWNFRGNGNSVEIRGGGGSAAMYLHLSEVAAKIRPGVHVHRGQVLGLSGNTGHSFAPHLHYQLMRGDRPVDPFDTRPTVRRSLPDSERPAFEAELRRLKTLLSATVAGK